MLSVLMNFQRLPVLETPPAITTLKADLLGMVITGLFCNFFYFLLFYNYFHVIYILFRPLRRWGVGDRGFGRSFVLLLFVLRALVRDLGGHDAPDGLALLLVHEAGGQQELHVEVGAVLVVHVRREAGRVSRPVGDHAAAQHAAHRAGGSRDCCRHLCVSL